MEKISLIQVELNHWNGFIFSMLDINDRLLFGIHCGGKSYLHIHILFFQITIWDKLEDEFKNRIK